ncbi:unnamed protein product [Onchocerca ochengi]|uniref:RNase H domain-containing protein n=1 Tax=Onchocerca ochengi TaxID=42157 RepID=A0A182EGN3_ONCOC|nr:unnamed protein product [Onchocerca ochengi]
MTIPKSELLAILIGVRAARFVIKQLDFENAKVTLWSDSRCALHWIQNHSADIVTKGISPDRLANFQLWWTGPAWLKDEESKWLQWEYNIHDECEESL